MEVMKRNEKGEVDLPDVDMQIRIPKDKLALSLFANNRIGHGFHFREDGWVYVEGERSHKWFTQIHSNQGGVNVNVWEPILKNVSLIEKRYSRMKKRYDRFLNEVFRPVFEKLGAVGRAHAKPTHKFDHYKDLDWWLYTTHPYEDTHSVGFEWVKRPNKPENLEIGQAYYELDKRLMQYSRYKSKFRTALAESIKRLLAKNAPKEENITLKLVINDKIFWYLSYKQHRYLGWKKIAWPEDQVKQLIVV